MNKGRRGRVWLIIWALWAGVLTGCAEELRRGTGEELISRPMRVDPAAPVIIVRPVADSLTKRIVIELENSGEYANLSLFADGMRIADNLNIPKSGKQTLSFLVRLQHRGHTEFEFRAFGAAIIIERLTFYDVEGFDIPEFRDRSDAVGLEQIASIKYGGPTIADIDNDGDYDFVVNNHNAESSKLYWNNGDGTVTKHDRNLSRWFMHDLHGTAAGDFDQDGDLDLVVTQGGGNGTNPSKANFYTNQDGTLVLTTGDVKIDRGGRGRGARWSDMDKDGDLDLLLFNEESLTQTKPQHFFYENLGNGTFNHKSTIGIEDVHPSRVLVTDLNRDQVDDFVFFGPLSVWRGNGDFTFTDITSQFPIDLANMTNIMAIADIDIDNDGDLDLYLARGKEFELGVGETPSVDFDPLSEEFSIKPRGFAGVDRFEFTAETDILFHNYYALAQGGFRGKDYPIFLGSEKSEIVLNSGDELEISREMASGWPDDISENGIYFGHVGSGNWKSALVRNANIFWGFNFSLSGVKNVSTSFTPQNRNESDILLRNDGERFVDISQDWRIPTGGNALGVTTGDFNNDGNRDLFVMRWGNISARTSDLMLLNSGEKYFETVTMHGANDVGGPGNGDMGQAFDFDLDGDLDLLNGSEGGYWYLYSNERPGAGNYVLVRVGNAPKSGIDPIAATVTVKTPRATRVQRVGSAGAVFSQSLLNIVHFGLGDVTQIDSIEIAWRNGETAVFSNKSPNRLFDTDALDPTLLEIKDGFSELREGASRRLQIVAQPSNANTQVTWSSSDDSVISVNDEGRVTALGQPGQRARIQAISAANLVSVFQEISIIDWEAKPVRSVTINPPDELVVEGRPVQLEARVSPTDADTPKLIWSSRDPEIATVDQLGMVRPVSAGVARIRVESAVNPAISDLVELAVQPDIEPYIWIQDEERYRSSPLVIGSALKIEAAFHAGTGNTVIASDEGGVRFWLRHFKSEWIPERDIVLTDTAALRAESGKSSMTISLDGLTPTADLPEGHFYLLRASFASSDGRMMDHNIYPLELVAPSSE